MSKKEIALFNVSFLDLLSGALAAVILLFILVPKTASDTLPPSIEEARSSARELDSLLQRVKGNIPEEEYRAIMDRSSSLQASLGKIEADYKRLLGLKQELGERLAEIDSLNRSLQDSVRQQAAEITNRQERIEELLEHIRQLEEIIRDLEERLNTTVQLPTLPEDKEYVEKTKGDTLVKREIIEDDPTKGIYAFGFNPPMGIRIDWSEKEVAVQLILENEKGQYVDALDRNRSWGTQAKLPSKIVSTPHMVILQKNEIVPGVYKVYANINKKTSPPAMVSGMITLNPPQPEGTPPRPQFIYISSRQINPSPEPYRNLPNSGTLLGVLTLTETNMTFEEER